jgi:hypothetical protein
MHVIVLLEHGLDEHLAIAQHALVPLLHGIARLHVLIKVNKRNTFTPEVRLLVLRHFERELAELAERLRHLFLELANGHAIVQIFNTN